MSDDTPPWESKPAKQEALYIHWCMHEGCKNGEALDLLAGMVSNGSALNTETMAIKRRNEPKA